MKLQNALFFIALIFSIFSINAQIKGKVVDALDNYPLEYASVAIYKVADKKLVTGVVTNLEGFFTIDAIRPGNYYIEVTFLGYETKVIKMINDLYNFNDTLNINDLIDVKDFDF